MPSIGKVVKKLNKTFDGKVTASKENGCLVLSGELERWHEVVKAGMIAGGEKLKINVVNKITCTVDKAMPVRKPGIEDNKLDGEEPDVLIIGGGVIGCAAARELSRYNLKIMVIEKEHDVAVQASGHSIGLVHSGIKFRNGTKRLYYTTRGNQMLEDVCSELGVPFSRCGQYLINLRHIWSPFLFISRLYWLINGIKGIQIAKGNEVHANEPGLTGNIGSAMFLPTGGVVCPQTLTIAYAENAAQNGVRFSFNTMAQEMEVAGDMIKSVTTNRGTIHPKIVINAAGIFCEDIAEMAGDCFYSVHPVRGTSIVVDRRNADSLINTAVSIHGGIGSAHGRRRRRTSDNFFNVIKTVHGTAHIGPFFVETINKEDFSTDRYSVDKVIADGKSVVPDLDKKDVIEYFSSTGASTYENDFIVSEGKVVSNIIHAAGIHFPGLTASPAIALDISKKVLAMFGGEYNLSLNPEFNPSRNVPSAIRGIDPNTHESLVAANFNYGIIVCHCEQVSKGEITDALSGALPCNSIDGVSRRTRAGCGRCQGQNCFPYILDIIAEEKQIEPQNVHKSGRGSEVVFGNAAAIADQRHQAALQKERQELEDEVFSDGDDKDKELSESERLLKIAAQAEGRAGSGDEAEAAEQ